MRLYNSNVLLTILDVEYDSPIIEMEKWYSKTMNIEAKESKNMGSLLAASSKLAEALTLFSEGIDDYWKFLSLESKKSIKTLAKEMISFADNVKNSEDFKKNIEEKDYSANIGTIQRCASFILWRISSFEQKSENDLLSWKDQEVTASVHSEPLTLKKQSFSYKQLYKDAKNAVDTDEKAELIATLRSWRQEDMDELDKLLDN